MRRFCSRNLGTLGTLLLLLLWHAASAQKPLPRILHDGGDSLVLELEFPLPHFEPLDDPERWVLPTLPGAVSRNEEGSPQLPMLALPYAVKNASGLRVYTLERQDTLYTDIRIAPSRGRITRDEDPSLRPRREGPVYQQDAYYPREIVQVGSVYQLHEQLGQSLVLNPLQYNPQRRTLRAVRRMRIALTGLKSDRAIEAVINSSSHGNAIEEQFSPRGVRRTRGDKREGLLIVSPPRYKEALSPLIKWKRLSGLRVEWQPFGDPNDPRSINDTAELKALIRKKYASPEGLHYVLLVGSRTEVPPLRRMGARRTSDSDQAYGQIQGNDSYNEVYVGRFSARTVEHVQLQVSKTIRYERNLNRADRWLGSALGIASNSTFKGDRGETDREHMRLIAKILGKEAYINSDSLFEGQKGATSLNLAQKLNAGIGYINYVGHGFARRWATTGFSVDDIGILTHLRATPFIMDVACSNGDMQEADPCFAEAWLWAKQGKTPTGAVAICAASDLQAWDQPMRAQDAFAEYVVGQHGSKVIRYGAVMARAVAEMLNAYPTGTEARETANTWNIFGDPSVMLRTHIPSPLTVTYDALLHDGQQDYALSVDVAGALAAACITSADGKERFHYTTASGGKAVFNNLALRKGERVEFAVTAFNHESFLSPVITVGKGTETRAELMDAQLYHDSGEPAVSVSPGETIKLRAAVCYKAGPLPASNVRIRYTVEPEQAAKILTDREEILPEFTEHGCTGLATRCKLQLGGDLSNGDQVSLYAEILVNGDVSSKLTLSTIVGAPAIRIDSARIVSDADKDHRIAAGEAFTLGVWVSNVGSASVKDARLVAHFAAGGQSSNKQTPIGTLAPNAQTMASIELVMPASGVDSTSICQVRVTPHWRNSEGPTTRSIVPMGRNYLKHPPEEVGYPFAQAGLQQITRILLPNELLGSNNRRVKGVEIPVRFEGGNEGQMLRARAFLQTAENTSWKEVGDFDALFRQSPNIELPVKKGLVTIPFDFFDIADLQPVCLTIVAEGDAAMRPYAVEALRANAPRTVSYTKQADGTVAMAYHMRAPRMRLIDAGLCRYHFHVLAPNGKPTRNFRLQIGEWIWNGSGGRRMEVFVGEGHHELKFTSSMYRDVTVKRTLVGSSVYDTIQLQAADTVRLMLLVQDQDGRPIEQAIVRIGDQERRTNSIGKLILAIVPGSYTLTASAPGFEVLTSPFAVNKTNAPAVITLRDESSTAVEERNTLAVWPNPSRERITVRSPFHTGHLTIYNTTGQVVKRQSVDGPETGVDVSGLGDGIYLVEVTGPEGNTLRGHFVKSIR